MTRLFILPALLLTLLLATPAGADDFQKGWDAYRNKDYATALREGKSDSQVKKQTGLPKSVLEQLLYEAT